MIQGRCGASLLLEPPESSGVGAELGGQDLDGDVTTKPRIAGAIHLAHAAAANQRHDLVSAEASAGSESHVASERPHYTERSARNPRAPLESVAESGAPRPL